MRIGVDLWPAHNAQRTAYGAYARALVDHLRSRFPEHQWLVCRDEASPDGQLAMEQASAQVDFWLTAMAVDPSGAYVPPSAPLEGLPLGGLVCDLAPAMVPDRFVMHESVVERYRRSLQALPRYDLLLTLSESTRIDCFRSFEIDENRVVTIGPACDDRFLPVEHAHSPTAESRSALEALGIRDPFALCLAADNEDRSVAVWMAAVERLPTVVLSQHQFVIACRLSQKRQAEWRGQFGLRNLGQRLLLIDAENNEVRRLLYQHCEVAIDSSPFEGSGLTLLHALQCGAAAIVDRRSPHAALAGDAAVLVDVDQPASLSARLEQVLGDGEVLAGLRKRAPAAARRYVMESVADQAMTAILAAAQNKRGREGEGERGRLLRSPPLTLSPSPTLETSSGRFGGHTANLHPHRHRPQLAFFSPLLPLRSGIADYSERLLAVLKRHFWIDLYHDQTYLPQLSVSSSDYACRDHRLFERFERATQYAGIIYQMANTHLCAYLYERLLKHPGVVVLHDYALPEFHFGYALRCNTPADFIAEEIAFESPELGREYRASGESWRSEAGGLSQACLSRGLAFNRRVLEAAAIIVVHDRSGEVRIASAYPHLAERVRVIPHGTSLNVVPDDEKPALRQRYGFAHDDLILSCFGFLNGAKYHSEIIEAVARLIGDYPSVQLIFVGDDLNEGREPAKAAELGLGDHVRFFGHAPMETFLDLMAITDLAMNLRRPPTRGETSGALLTLLSAGVPTIVTDVDTFSSYPDNVVHKIGPLSAGDESLVQAIRGLVGQPERRMELGQAAIRYVSNVHSWDRVASLYADAVDQARGVSTCRAA